MEGVSVRYASALFSLAIEENKVSKYQKDMKFILSLFEGNDELSLFFNHFNIDKEDKKNLITTVFKKEIENNIVNFLLLLIDKNRFKSLKDIIKEFNSMANKFNNVVEGLIYSSVMMNKEEINKIELALARKLNSKVELSNKIDTSLIGGFKIIIGDTIYDSSLKNKLNTLKHELLEGKVNKDGY